MPTLVLLPGMDGSGSLFAPFVAALGHEIPICIVRYPAQHAYGYAELEQIARATLPMDGAIVLLGESFSGPIAISLASRFPHRVAGLILCCTFASNPRPRLSIFGPLLPALPVGLVPTRLLVHGLLGNYATAARRRAFADAIADLSADAVRARLKAVLAVDVSRELGALTVPVLDLRAADDHVVPPAAASTIMRLCRDARRIVLPGPHALLQASPEAAATVVRAFLREVDRASSP